MGMDIYGCTNENAYFRANVWSWRPIHELLREIASDLIDEETMDAIGYNGGAGVEDPEVCRLISYRVRDWISEAKREGIEEFSMPSEKVAVIDGRFVEPGTPGSRSPYRAGLMQITEFANFLDECGGFKVW